MKLNEVPTLPNEEVRWYARGASFLKVHYLQVAPRRTARLSDPFFQTEFVVLGEPGNPVGGVKTR